jgi:hypothetical protein
MTIFVNSSKNLAVLNRGEGDVGAVILVAPG